MPRPVRGSPLSARDMRLLAARLFAVGLAVGLPCLLLNGASDYRAARPIAAAGCVPLAGLVLARACHHRRDLGRRRACLALQLDALSLWLGYTLAWAITERYDGRLFLILAAGWSCSSAAAHPLLLALRRLRPPVERPAPTCPRCTYSLVGLTSNRCPECGTPFSLPNLGLTPADVAP